MIYVFRVNSGKEKDCIDFMHKYYPEIASNMFFPMRKLFIKRKGVEKIELQSLYPGYLFYENDNLSINEIEVLKIYNNFLGFLPMIGEPIPLLKKEETVIKELLDFGEVVEISKVEFNVDDRIVVKDGPLKGHEGRIVKVDKRKKRAKVSLNFYSKPFLIDFAFEIME